MTPRSSPPTLLATSVVLVLTVTWVAVRLAMFAESFLPVTYVIPLLVCIWTRRDWHLWFMAATFFAGTTLKAFGGRRGLELPEFQEQLLIISTYFNIVIGAFIVKLVMRYQDRLDERAAMIAAQNQELEKQSEELVQQNEEIRAQAEELAQQNEEMQAQAEELVRQNDELHVASDRLGSREQLLQDLLQTSRGSDDHAVLGLCHRALAVVGTPTDHIGILELTTKGALRLVAQAATGGPALLPSVWPVERSLAGVVVREDRTAYVSDFAIHPELAAPFDVTGPVRSLLATPLRREGRVVGVLAVGSAQPGHWSDEQFQLLEWLAALCSQLMKGIQWRQTLTERTRELEAANHAKDDFLAMLSHELRTPLTPVLAAAGVLVDDPRLPPDVREDLGMIRRNVTIQSRLIDDLLDLTRIERRKLELNLQPCTPHLLLRDAAMIVNPDLDAREQQLVVNCEIADQWRISGDTARLQQVLWNLLQNAAKFSPPRTRIHLSARQLAGQPARAEISVEDEGPGIPADETERIFKPFEQLRNGRRVGRETGLGLGLAIARAVVELHGGRLGVSVGALGRGSRFVVELPMVLAARSGNSAAPRETGADATRLPALSILLVEDHADTGRVVAQLLRGAGHEVVHCTSVADAITRFDRGIYQLLISDLGLPDESGLFLMRKLRELQPDLCGICMTGYGMDSDLRACREAGFTEHLAKPVDVQRLHAAIARVCRSIEPLTNR